MWVVYLVVATGFMCSIVTWLRRSRHDTIGVPEGPRGYPILGCFSLLRRYPEQTLHKWAQEYESPYSFTIGNQRIVVISDPKTAKTLFLKNGSICSDRMDTFVKSQTILKGRSITSTTCGHTWRKHRKIAKTALEPRDVGQQTDVLDAETTKMIRALYRDGENEKQLNPQVSIGRCSLNCMAAITFGSPRICVPDAQVLSLSREFMNTTDPMANLVDFVPVWLQQSLPWGMKRRGKRLHAALVNTYGRQVKRIERDMKNNVHVKDCLVKTMVTRREEEQLDDLDMAMLASAFMVGGVETTASIIQWFSALIPSHGHIQRKAHEELDRVVGRSRLPTLEDKPDLHYCRAIIKEVERCHNPFWLGTPHVASKDLVCNNKLIPAGSVLILNTWTMHHDRIRFPDPLSFNPDRYLENSHSSTEPSRLKDSRLRDNWTFGVGRRICPGILVAQREIWLAVTKILWAFVLAEVPGHPIDLNEYDGVSGRSPVPFKIMLKPRFNEVVEVMAEAEKAWTE